MFFFAKDLPGHIGKWAPEMMCLGCLGCLGFFAKVQSMSQFACQKTEYVFTHTHVYIYIYIIII